MKGGAQPGGLETSGGVGKQDRLPSTAGTATVLGSGGSGFDSHRWHFFHITFMAIVGFVTPLEVTFQYWQ